jgi:hypothetical protein
MQTERCDVSGEFMALHNEKQASGTEIYTLNVLDPGNAFCLKRTLDQSQICGCKE